MPSPKALKLAREICAKLDEVQQHGSGGSPFYAAELWKDVPELIDAALAEERRKDGEREKLLEETVEASVRMANRAVKIVPDLENDLAQATRVIGELVKAGEVLCRRIVSWESAVQKIIGRQPESGMCMQELQAALSGARAYLKGAE